MGRTSHRDVRPADRLPRWRGSRSSRIQVRLSRPNSGTSGLTSRSAHGVNFAFLFKIVINVSDAVIRQSVHIDGNAGLDNRLEQELPFTCFTSHSTNLASQSLSHAVQG